MTSDSSRRDLAKIIATRPHWIIRWGITLLWGLVVLLGVVWYFIFARTV